MSLLSFSIPCLLSGVSRRIGFFCFGENRTPIVLGHRNAPKETVTFPYQITSFHFGQLKAPRQRVHLRVSKGWLGDETFANFTERKPKALLFFRYLEVCNFALATTKRQRTDPFPTCLPPFLGGKYETPKHEIPKPPKD